MGITHSDPWEPQGNNPLGPPGPELRRTWAKFQALLTTCWVSVLI